MNTRRYWSTLLPALVFAAAACTQQTAAVPNHPVSPSRSRARVTAGVTLTLEPRSDGRCCLVSSVNPGDAPTTVVCFVEVFNEVGQLQSTHLVPPKPPGHTRSSGFEARPGRTEHGFQAIPLDVSNQRYTSTCRPAAWHGGSPI